LAKILLENQERLWDLMIAQGMGFDTHKIRRSQEKGKGPRLLELTFNSMTYSDSVSNSHCAPHDGVKNWSGQNKNAPTGYPGWQGRLNFAEDKPSDISYFSSAIFGNKKARIHTGGGGGSGQKEGEPETVRRCSYDLKLFASDWPGMKEQREKDLVIKALTTEYA